MLAVLLGYRVVIWTLSRVRAARAAKAVTSTSAPATTLEKT
jgi:hypothetical protein